MFSTFMCRTRVDCLARRWPRKMAKVKVGSRRPAVLTRMLGSQQMDVLGVLGEGAFAVIFSCKISEGQRRVAVKLERQVRTVLFSGCVFTAGLSSEFLACLVLLRPRPFA